MDDKLVERKEIMLKMRGKGISDVMIGEIVGVSRQRVGQIIGEGGSGLHHIPPNKDEVIPLWEVGGYSIRQLANITNTSHSTIERILEKHYGKKEFRERMSRHNVGNVRNQIADWLTRNSDFLFTYHNVLKTEGYNCAMRWGRYGSYPFWRKEFGQPVKINGKGIKMPPRDTENGCTLLTNASSASFRQGDTDGFPKRA